jgi:predicted small secreted protein
MQLIKSLQLILIAILLFSCASTTKTVGQDIDSIIFKKVLEFKNFNNYYLLHEANSNNILALLNMEYPTFFDFWEYNSYQNYISKEDAKNIFNDIQLTHFNENFKDSITWSYSLFEKQIHRKDLKKIKQEYLKGKDGISFFSLSRVIYTNDNKYALIMYSVSENVLGSSGNGGVLIYKFENGEWKYLTQLFYHMS